MSETKKLIESVQTNLNEGSALRVFKPDSEEYTRLSNFVDELNNDERFQAEYKIEETYFDYGQNWKWTTIIAHKTEERGGGWQALTPKNQERVILGVELDKVKEDLLNNEEKLIGKNNKTEISFKDETLTEYSDELTNKVGGNYDDFISEIQGLRQLVVNYIDECSTHLAEEIVERTTFAIDDIIRDIEREKDIEIEGAMNE